MAITFVLIKQKLNNILRKTDFRGKNYKTKYKKGVDLVELNLKNNDKEKISITNKKVTNKDLKIFLTKKKRY